MVSSSPERWRPDARFFLRGGATVFGIGVLVALLTQLGAGELRLLDLLLFSDGLPEAPDPSGEPLGYEALVELLPPLESEPGAWLDELFARVRQGTASELADDWTALLLERV